MKKIYCIMFALLGMGGVAEAQTPKQTVVDGVAVSDFKMERNGGYMAVDMMLDLSDLDIESNRAVLLTPRLVNGADSLDLPAVGIYGRRRYYFYVRHGESMLSGATTELQAEAPTPRIITSRRVDERCHAVAAPRRLRLLPHAAGRAGRAARAAS
ncbi:MAG: DUF3868 domain-containing protein [Merdibacter sp.]